MPGPLPRGSIAHRRGSPVAAIDPTAATQVTAEPVSAAKATFGTFGFDNAGMDTSVTPGDDFYLYANGNWAKNTPIPPDKSNFGAFTVLQDLSQQRVRDILEAAKTDPGSRIGMAYASFLDEAAVEGKGLTPIDPWLDKVLEPRKASTGIGNRSCRFRFAGARWPLAEC